MNRMRAIAEALVVTPGMTVSEIGRAIGQTSAPERNRISASLCTMARMGRVRHNNQPDGSGRRRWFATEQALVDRRRPAKPRHKKAANSVKKACKPPKPPASAGMTIIAKRIEPVAAHRGPPETVEQWMARTGERPEVLSPYASSKPLKYDHAEAHAKRRGIAHHVRQGAP